MRRGKANWSLRQRLMSFATLTLLISIVFGGFAMHRAEEIEEGEFRDIRLRQFGTMVRAFVEADTGIESLQHLVRIKPIEPRPEGPQILRYQVWSKGGLLLRTDNAPADSPLIPVGQFGFSDLRRDDYAGRVYALPAKGAQLVIQVSEQSDDLLQHGDIVARYAFALVFVPFALLFGIASRSLRHSLRAVESMASQLAQRNPLEMSPIQLVDPPQELLPILHSTDDLLARLGQNLSASRNFTALAAHELRTPLAGLRAQAQVAAALSGNEEMREALSAIQTGVDKASYLLDQLLDLARLDALPATSAGDCERLDVVSLYDEVMADLARRGESKQMTICASFDTPQIEGHRFALTVLLRNLLANAIAYAPVGGRVGTCFEMRDGAVALLVDDSGPGIAAEDRERAFERFNRLGRKQGHGVGLGLSIVLTVVELHRARIELLDSPLGGLRVMVTLPVVARASDRVATRPV